MNCSDVERWLDRGMPDSGSERAMRHVAACGACFEAFEALVGEGVIVHDRGGRDTDGVL